MEKGIGYIFSSVLDSKDEVIKGTIDGFLDILKELYNDETLREFLNIFTIEDNEKMFERFSEFLKKNGINDVSFDTKDGVLKGIAECLVLVLKEHYDDKTIAEGLEVLETVMNLLKQLTEMSNLEDEDKFFKDLTTLFNKLGFNIDFRLEIPEFVETLNSKNSKDSDDETDYEVDEEVESETDYEVDEEVESETDYEVEKVPE